MAKTISTSSLQYYPQATITRTLSHLKLHVNLANSIATGYNTQLTLLGVYCIKSNFRNTLNCMKWIAGCLVVVTVANVAGWVPAGTRIVTKISSQPSVPLLRKFRPIRGILTCHNSISLQWPSIAWSLYVLKWTYNWHNWYSKYWKRKTKILTVEPQ